MSNVGRIVNDGLLLLLLTMAIPFAVLMIGIPLAAIIRIALEIVRAAF
jgi:hypothetical protein